MKESAYKLLPIVTALVMSLSFAACGGESEASAEGAGESSMAAETGERESAEREGTEIGGEHAEGAREGGEHSEGGEGREGGGEHDEGGESSAEGEGEHGGAEGGHDEGEEGEEPGLYIARGDTWDMSRRGARLVLAFDSGSGAFVGTVENTTNGTLCAVRVEVHLGDGPELGPTPRIDVPAGATTSITLSAEGEVFETWTAHPELSACSG